MRHGYVIVIAFGSLFSQISSKSGLIIAHIPRDIEQSESEITRATFFHVRIAAPVIFPDCYVEGDIPANASILSGESNLEKSPISKRMIAPI